MEVLARRRGLSNAEIAEKLVVSRRPSRRTSRVLAKLDIRDRVPRP
jgi:DNA-binding NarL/FixJ family response regulator